MPFASGVIQADQGFVLPHEWFAYVYKSFHGDFFKVFMGTRNGAEGKRKLMAFWGSIKESDPRRHALPADMPKDVTIPGWIHGDGVPCTKNDTMVVCSWGSTLSKWMWFASGYMNKLRSMVAGRGDQDQDTKAIFVKILTWSFRALAMGKFPAKDWQGNPWPKDSPRDKLKDLDPAGGP